MNARDKTKRAVMAVELDHAELTIRLMEIGIKLRRPKGVPASKVLASAKTNALGNELRSQTIQDFEDMATASILYLRDAINKMGTVQ